jgi:hypothetical protein
MFGHSNQKKGGEGGFWNLDAKGHTRRFSFLNQVGLNGNEVMISHKKSI